MNKEQMRKVFEKILPPSVGQQVLVKNMISVSEVILMEREVGHYPFKGTITRVENTLPLLFRVHVDTKKQGSIDYLFWRNEFEVIEDERKKGTKH